MKGSMTLASQSRGETSNGVARRLKPMERANVRLDVEARREARDAIRVALPQNNEFERFLKQAGAK